MNNDYSTEHKELLAQDATPEHNADFFGNLEAKLGNESVEAQTTAVLRRHWRSFTATASVAAIVLAVLATSSLISSNSSDSELATPPTTGTSTSISPNTTAPITETTQLELTLAAQIGQRAAARYTAIDSIAGTLTRTHALYPSTVRSFKARSDGSYFYELDGVGQSYDSLTGNLFRFEGDSVKHLATNTSIEGGIGEYGGFSLSNLLSGIALDDNAEVEETKLNGQLVWKIHSKLPNKIVGLGDIAPIGLDEIVSYFDQTTLFPVKIEAGGYTTTLTDLKVNQKYSDSDLKLNPAGADASARYDANQKRLSVAAIEKVSGKKILLPTTLPDNFKAGNYTWDDSYGRFQVTYRAGIQAITYTLDFKGNYPSAWTAPYGDPWFNLNEVNTKREMVTVTGGKYDGLNMTLVAGPASRPHAEVKGKTTTMYVGGDITTDELKTLINSVN